MSRTICLIAALFVFAGGIASARKAPKAGPSGTISGRVISDYAFVPTATVHVWLKGKEVAKSAVDAKGEFHFTVKPETYEVDAEAPRLRSKLPVHTIVVVHPGHETWVNIELVP